MKLKQYSRSPNSVGRINPTQDKTRYIEVTLLVPKPVYDDLEEVYKERENNAREMFRAIPTRAEWYVAQLITGRRFASWLPFTNTFVSRLWEAISSERLR